MAQTFVIVDSSEENLLFWEVAIKENFEDAAIITYENGYEALESIKKLKGKINFFIMSWEMEPLSGLVFMQKLKEIHRFKHTPHLIFSHVLTEEDLFLADEFGIRNYLTKPFTREDGIQKIKKMLDEEKNLDRVQVTLRKIEDWLGNNKISDAMNMIRDCLKPGPHAPKAYFLNGEIWSRTDKLEKAEEQYKKSLSFDESYSPALNGLGKLYLKLNRYSEAVKQFEQLHEKSPKNIGRMISLGNAYLGNGEEDKAEEMFNKVSGLDEGNEQAKAGMGKVNFAKGRFELAAKFFKESGKGQELASYFNNLGIAMVNQGRNEEAVGLYNNAMGVLPTKDKWHLLYFNIGLAYKKCEQFKEGVESFARSIIEDPSYTKAYAALLVCLKELKAKKLTYDETLVQKAVKLFQKNRDENLSSEAS